MTALKVTAKLWVKNARFAEFEAFEEAAFSIMTRHGAKVLDVRKNHRATDGQPHEIHTLEFPDQSALDAYQHDPDLVAMASLRNDCIDKTELTVTPH